MLQSIINIIKNLFRSKSISDNLELYIAAGHPKTNNDIDRLEKEFWEKNIRVNVFDRYI